MLRFTDSHVKLFVVVGNRYSGAPGGLKRSKIRDARILILDNHDDFGGHAKRNEFQIGDRTLVGYGGSCFLEQPSDCRDIVNNLLHDLEDDLKRFETTFDQGFYKRHGLRAGSHFSREKWNTDRTVPFSGPFFDYLPMATTTLSVEESINQMPIPAAANKGISFYNIRDH
ncbi:MAG TPA: hypothetical protein EYG52_06180 [Pseudomonadales bacterium]|jgi:spermidine dehydrogenase|nr:hypothetical protein [Gammaproteobacteria bacterium]HIL83083.1 hypothetical protein [Pseudomonadales bacterium]